jgi:hypothetical protein
LKAGVGRAIKYSTNNELVSSDIVGYLHLQFMIVMPQSFLMTAKYRYYSGDNE